MFQKVLKFKNSLQFKGSEPYIVSQPITNSINDLLSIGAVHYITVTSDYKIWGGREV